MDLLKFIFLKYEHYRNLRINQRDGINLNICSEEDIVIYVDAGLI